MPTAKLQRHAVQKGIVISGEHYIAYLYDPKLNPPCCYRCYRRGHVSATCRARWACGYCAGEHDTRECTKRDQENQAKCTLCRGPHPAWAKAKCPAHARHKEEKHRLRMQLLRVEADWDHDVRRQGAGAPPPAPITESGKRRRIDGPEDRSRRRSAGRPRWTATRQEDQNTLKDFIRGSQQATGRPDTPDIDMGAEAGVEEATEERE
jgi:hypothetical protein